ncbi:hypothetical protein, partial [Parabacteroides goldsteinii]|uniref:hypothetical protein n=1 Tax=Parabacteroides goldsteinii TaxID=328812 RepID=UPI003AB24853
RKMNEKHEYLMLNHATNRGYCGGTTTNLCLKRSSRTVSPPRIDAFILEWGIEKVIGGVLSKSDNDFDISETIFDTTVTASYIPSSAI